MWDSILTGLEDDRAAATLMSVDFSKAFNRMEHQECLKALARKGCSYQTLLMIYHFLSGRKMCIKNGYKMSKPRNITGGSPQGTKLGNVLFCITVEDIEMDRSECATVEATNTVEPTLVPMSPIYTAVPDQYRSLSLIHI